MTGRRHRRSVPALVLLVLLAGLAVPRAAAKPVPSDPMPEATEAFIEAGRTIYFRRCSFCHGLLGDGEGPAAEFMDPRPRDFTLGTFKFRSTQSGELPTDADLFRTVSRGLPGTGMQAFDSDLIKNGLNEEQRWQVIAYIKTFAPEFDDPELDPVQTGKVISLPEARAPYNADTIAKGEAVFERAKCWECHGKRGRGDDLTGQPDVHRVRLLPGRVVVTFGHGAVDQQDVQHLVIGQLVLQGLDEVGEVPAVLLAQRLHERRHRRAVDARGEAHVDVFDLGAALDLPGMGDVADADRKAPVVLAVERLLAVAAPRWQNPSIELVTLRAIANDDDIAFKLVWDDAFQDITHDDGAAFDATELAAVGAYNSYVPANQVIPRQLETFRDAVALQFPAKPLEGTRKPHFFRGSGSNPVNLWLWQADNGVQEAVARGWKQALKPQPEAQQQLTADAVWSQGRWQLVLKRPRVVEERNEVQFVAGRFIPIAVNAWDGSNGEHGQIMSLSTWYHVFIEAPTPLSVYAYTAIAVVLAGALGFCMVRRAEARVGTQENKP